MGKARMHTAFWRKNKEEGDHLEGLEAKWEGTLTLILLTWRKW
jgi:hypothetical protein